MRTYTADAADAAAATTFDTIYVNVWLKKM